MKIKLQTRYTAIIVILIIVIVSVLSIVLTQQYKSSAQQMTQEGGNIAASKLLAQMEKRASSLAMQLSENIVNYVYLYNMEDIFYALQTTRNEADVRYVHVYDKNYNILHDGTKTIETYGEEVIHKNLAELALSKNKAVTDIRENEYIVTYPIRLGEDILGGVIIVLSLDSIQQDIEILKNRLSDISEQGLQKNTWLVVLLTLVLVSMGVLMAIIVASHLITPIKQISNYAAQIGHGNYDVELDINRNDEIGDLMQSLEEMRSNLKRNTDEIRYLAYHDKLTKLPNRTMFNEYLDNAIESSRRHSKVLAVIFIDLDDFKRVNDTFGHQVGDHVLKTQANRIIDCLRSADYVAVTNESDDALAARIGGDEFIALLPMENDHTLAAVAARRLLDELSQPIPFQNNKLYVGASIGISIYPNDGNSADILIKNADIAMYYAKDKGKNHFKYFTESMNQYAKSCMQTELDLREAIKEKQLELHYQPQLDLLTGKVKGAEVLLRWNHPSHGMVLPDDFIQVAENTGLIVNIGETVLYEALLHAKHFREVYDENYFVAVNVSSVQFRHSNLSNIVESVLHKVGIDGNALHIEITESSLMTSEKIADTTINKLNKMGIKILIDDFGTGYSSLSYLRRFSVSGLKIDKSFIQHMHLNQEDKKLTSAIIALAHSLGIKVVAEGVELVEHEECLCESGCDFAQGFLYSRAVSADEYEKLYTCTIEELKNMNTTAS